MPTREIIEADLTWTVPADNGVAGAGRFERGIRIAVESGQIVEVGRLAEQPTMRLANRALIPGMINVHSHAFQRGLRGHGERFPTGAGSFWTWREAMYELVKSLDAAKIHELSLQCFREMLAAGITTVGEFHYVHHDASEQGYVLDEVVLRAAADAGIRIALINCYYRTGGINKPLAGGQLRFRTNTPEEYWEQMDRLVPLLDRSTQTLAAAAHSIRAATIDEIAELHVESIKRGMPFHMHVEEQPQEIHDCVQMYGKPPMALLNQKLAINPMFTAIHCTHTAAADMDDYLGRGGNVGINPLTEGNLGDGIPAVGRILKRGGHISFGSDSNNRLSWTEEMRWLEYGQRLNTLSRGICVDESGSVAAKLLDMATINGARSLGLKAGRIAPKYHADFVALDLENPSLRGWSDDSLLDSFVFGTGNEAIADVCVGGKWIGLGGDR